MANQEHFEKSATQGKTPQQLEREIAETRQSIGADLRALGEKLPTTLKDEARGVIQEAKDGAKEVIRDARDAATDSLRSAREQAMGAVNETVGEIKEEARRVTHATTEFVGRNAVPLALIGLGVGWLMFAPRHRSAMTEMRNLPTESRRSFRSSHSAPRTDGALSVMRQKIVTVGEQSADAAKEMGERAAHLTHDLSQGAVRQWERGRQGVMELARDNPLAVGAAVVATGVGVGLLLPKTAWENQLMGQARDRLLDEGKGLAGELRETTQRVGRGAREALADVRQSVGQGAGDTQGRTGL